MCAASTIKPGQVDSEVSQLLEAAERSAEEGKRGKAYESSLKATAIAPDVPMAWYLRSRSAPSREEQLMCLSRAYSLDPALGDARDELRLAVGDLLRQEPFVAYVHETAEFYQVRSGRDLLVNVPKNRAHERPYLQRRRGPAAQASRWLSYALIGMLLGGIGALVLAPVAAFQALRLQFRAKSHEDRVRSWIILIGSLVLWAAAIPLSWLFLIRLFP